LRIRLQKSFQIAQTLPRPSIYTELFNTQIQSGSNDDKTQTNRNEIATKLKRVFSQIKNESLKLSNNISQIQAHMLIDNDEIDIQTRNKKKQRLDNNGPISIKENDENAHDEENRVNGKKQLSMEALWDEMNEDWKTLLPYYGKTLNEWDRKMRLLEPHVNNQNKNNMDLSLSERLSLLLDRPQRVLAKMQSVERNFKMFGDNENNVDNETKNEKKLRKRQRMIKIIPKKTERKRKKKQEKKKTFECSKER